MMTRFKWFALGVIAVTCFWFGMAIYRMLSDKYSIYQTFVDTVAVAASLATIVALMVAYFTYKKWMEPIKAASYEKCLDKLENRTAELCDMLLKSKEQQATSKGMQELYSWFNDVALKDDVYLQAICYHLSRLRHDDLSDIVRSRRLTMRVLKGVVNSGIDKVYLNELSNLRTEIHKAIEANSSVIRAIYNILMDKQY